METTLKEHSHEYWMRKALEQGAKAADCDEVPIGAVVVRDGVIIGSGFNQTIGLNDPTAHAEILALRQASKTLENYRLPGSTLYVTIEPCTMCAGALVHARVSQLVFGAREPKAGAVRSHQELLGSPQFNHKVEVLESVLADECSEQIQAFFRAKRLVK